MLNLRGLEVACIEEVDGGSVRRKVEMTVYYWFFVFFIAFLTLITPLLPLLHYFGILRIMVAVIRVGFREHSSHLISQSI